jgi:hypothetical protein
MTQPLTENEGTQFPTTAEMRRRALQLLEQVPSNTLITYRALTAALGLNPQHESRARSAVLQAGRDLLKDQNKKIVNVRDQGYRIIQANEHVTVSQHEQLGARRRLRRALQTVTHVALHELTTIEIAKVMMEQARVAISVGMLKKLTKAKELPPTAQLHLPSASKLIEFMRSPRKQTGPRTKAGED